MIKLDATRTSANEWTRVQIFYATDTKGAQVISERRLSSCAKRNVTEEPGGITLGLVTRFLDFARNDSKDYPQTNSRSLGRLSRLAPFKCR